VLSALGLLALAALSLLLPKDEKPAADRLGMWKNFRTVFVYPPALAGLAMGFLISAANEVVNLVFGVWMEDAFGLKIAALGAASAVIGLSELGGESLVSLLTDRLGKERAVGAGIALNSLAALALPFLGREFLGALVGLFLFYITFEFTLVSAIPLMSEILPPARATLMSLNLAGHTLGRALGSLLASSIYAFGILSSGLAAAGFNLLALAALGLLVFWSSTRRKQFAGD
jgi:predicted MFS family arabinose efflux permease